MREVGAGQVLADRAGPTRLFESRQIGGTGRRAALADAVGDRRHDGMKGHGHTSDPIHVGLLGVDAVVLEADFLREPDQATWA